MEAVEEFTPTPTMSIPEGLKQFYRGKNIFITGATGFLGVCLLEKILRCIPDVGDIYLLMRSKKNQTLSERWEQVKKNSVFEKLLETKSAETIFSKVTVIEGDVGTENLGLSDNDKDLLRRNVNVIFHSAATLDFGESLKTTLDVNLLGTRRVLALAKQCNNFNVFVYVSSAYSNSYLLEVEEKIYPLSKTAEELIDAVSKLTETELEKETPKLIGNHPNAYTITKHLAELEVQKCQDLFPCTIVRPSMIVGSLKEPVPGWTISKNGPQGFLMGAAKGVVRRLPVAEELIYDYIPVDIVVNNLLAAGYYSGATKSKKLEIYHCTSSTRNPFKWQQITGEITNYLHKYPLKSAVWYPHIKLVPSIRLYTFSAFFVHIIPALLLDTVTRLTGGRPILMKLHRNVNKSLGQLERFIFTEWKFFAKNTEKLQKYLKNSEQEEFNLDVSGIEWVKYFETLTLGARTYLSKEPLKTLPAARRKDIMLLMIHCLLQLSIIYTLYYISSCIGLPSVLLPVLYLGLFQFL